MATPVHVHSLTPDLSSEELNRVTGWLCRLRHTLVEELIILVLDATLLVNCVPCSNVLLSKSHAMYGLG